MLHSPIPVARGIFGSTALSVVILTLCTRLSASYRAQVLSFALFMKQAPVATTFTVLW